MRDGDLILKVEDQSGEGVFGGLTVFDLSASNTLEAVGRAARAQQDTGGRWKLAAYAESRFDARRVEVRRERTRELTTRISAAFLGVATADTTQMSVRALRNLIQYLRSNGQETRGFEFAMWSRIARVVAVFFAVLLALPFVFGALRSTGASARAAQGLVLGLAYFLLEKMVESSTQAFALDPVLLAWAPTALLAAVVGALVLRLR